LFFHLVGAFCFFMGGAVAGTLQVAALREERPSAILTLLRLTRVGVVLVGVGALMTLGFGIALAEDLGYGLSPAWIRWAIGLWVASMVLGGLGGRTARQARYRAEQAVAAGDNPDEELRRLVAHRPSLWLSWISGALLVVILVLMVWKP
jgi:uncharacterized membrane protein